MQPARSNRVQNVDPVVMAAGVLTMKPFGEIPTLLAVLACPALIPTARAEVYKWVDDEGVVHYSAEQRTKRPRDARPGAFF